jgi:hypothetical protein
MCRPIKHFPILATACFVAEVGEYLEKGSALKKVSGKLLNWFHLLSIFTLIAQGNEDDKGFALGNPDWEQNDRIKYGVPSV